MEQGFRGNCDSKGKQRSVFAEPDSVGFPKSTYHQSQSQPHHLHPATKKRGQHETTLPFLRKEI